MTIAVALGRKATKQTKIEDLNLILREREGFAALGVWSVLLVQSEQHVIYRLMAGGGQGGQGIMEETDGKRLL